MKLARKAMARSMFVFPDAFAPKMATKVGKRSFEPETGCTKRPGRSGAFAATVRLRVCQSRNERKFFTLTFRSISRPLSRIFVKEG